MPQAVDSDTNDCLLLPRSRPALPQTSYQVYVITWQAAAGVMRADCFLIGCVKQAVDHPILDPMRNRFRATRIDEPVYGFKMQLSLDRTGHGCQ